MPSITRSLATALTVATLSLALSACNNSDTSSEDEKKPAAAAEEGGPTIEGLDGDKAQAGYMIGMEMAKSLDQVKDEIDIDTLLKAIRDNLEGKAPLMDEDQAAQVAERLGQRVTKKVSEKNAKEGAEFLAENGKKEGVTTTESGLQYEVISEGDGPKPKADDIVRVHYKGTLLDGTVFDDSSLRGEPAMMPLKQMLAGWVEGLTLMPTGSKYRLWIPAELGYGDMGTPGGPIGPNATLVFEVELLGIEDAPPPAKQ